MFSFVWTCPHVTSGTYEAQKEVVRIQSFASSMRVIASKQRPRKLIVRGSDAADYMFLLKGTHPRSQ
jgi:FKBP12-rapamycin complex-associated protein